MNKIIRELRDRKARLVDEAQQLIADGKIAEAKAKNAEIASINDQIEAIENLEAESARNSKTKQLTQEEIDANKAADMTKAEKVEAIRKTPEYRNAWIHAIRNHATIKDIMTIPGYAPLKNALTETGGDPVGEDGGFLVPIEFDNLIWTLRRDYTALADLVTVETVNGLTGWRAVEKSALTTGFADLTEAQPIPPATEPKFVKVPYTLKGYGGLIEVSNDLLNDSPVNLMRYLANWFARKSVLTENALILGILNALTAVAYDSTKKITPLKTALNKTLDPAISRRAVILTNQSGFDYLDQQEDSTGRPLLQPDLTNPTQYKALGRPVVVLSDALMPNTGSGKFPLFVGDFKECIDMFRRGALEMASTNVGGTAFVNATTLVRGITRLDAVQIDASAVCAMQIGTVGS